MCMCGGGYSRNTECDTYMYPGNAVIKRFFFLGVQLKFDLSIEGQRSTVPMQDCTFLVPHISNAEEIHVSF